MKGIKRHNLPVIKYTSHKDIMYSMVTVINTILHILKLLRVNLKSSNHKKNSNWGNLV